MSIKGKNKFGLKLEDFDSYKDYRKALRRLHDSEYDKSEKGKLRNSKYDKSEKGVLRHVKYGKSEKGRLVKIFLENKRRSYKLQRTVPWSNLKAIKQFYLNCPKGHQVDHIIPLKGKNVSGLHVLDNLQYLTASENASKGNKYECR